jgi:anaerobic magnesium-protoporphyrin IX monomethyl ester cyclase
MRIAGIYPQGVSIDPKTQHMYGSPVGLESVLAAADEAGHETRLFMPVMLKGDGLINIPEEELISAITCFAPDIAAFSLMTCQFNTAKRIASELKQKRPYLVIVAGGRHPTAVPEIEDPFDFFILGEGERAFTELLTEIDGNHDYERISGIAFRRAGGEPVITAGQGTSDNSGFVRFRPENGRFLGQAYRGLSYPSLSQQPRYALIEYSRGCTGACFFCDARHVWKGKIRHRQASDTVREMKYLQEVHGIDLFYIIDLNFTAIRSKVLEFCDELRRQGVHSSWYCMSNLETADAGALEAMKETGCFKIAWGVESTDDKSRRRMKKSLFDGTVLNRTQVIEKLELSAQSGIINNIFYIIGFPWQTEDSIISESEALSGYPAHQINVGIATPFPGTQWYQEIDKDILNQNLDLYDRNHLVYRHATLTNEKLKLIQEQIHRSFYSSPEYLERVKRLISISPHFMDSFNDYFRFLSFPIRV